MLVSDFCMKTTKTKIEISAGGLIVCKRDGKWWILLMKDPKGEWTFPKGKIEKGEDTLKTATREIGEEVNLHNLSYRATLTPSQYWYYRDGAVKKTVHYLVFEVPKMEKPTVQKEEGIQEARWVRFDEADDMIGYPKTNAPLLEESAHIVKAL